ncbi:hypothetical protein BKA70DRAFT_874808 [Coprinopsis sp. MPI-PUGE-AT-0042]|nr:hypothetical protein BKA70DRAFT_874808 [Coprinopsis sp. MPI-PUGE-AT-0042]
MALASHVQAKVGLPSDENEKDLALQYAELVFTETFGFPISNDSSFVPPGGATPLNLRTSEKGATIEKANQTSIREFLGSAVSNLGLLSWMTGDAVGDVLKLSETILEAVTDQWLFVSLAKVYTPANLSTACPVKCDLVVAYFTDSSDAPNKTIELGLVAVYYDMLPSLDWAQFQMRLNAYKAASTGLSNGNQSVRDDKALKSVAQEYSKSEFARSFSYQWGQNPPDFVNNGQYTRAQSAMLAYFEDGKTGQMEAFVRNKILEGASVPAWAEADVVKDLVDINTTNLSIEPNTRSWSVNKYDKSYNDPNGNEGTFRVNGLFVSYTSSQVLLSKATAQIAYLFWLGETYTKPALQGIVYGDMISELFNNLHSEMSQVSTSGLQGDKQGLQELLERCGIAQFRFYTNYDFSSERTEPPRSNGDEVYAIACFGEIGDPVTDSAVADWTAKNIFKPNSFSFFSSVPEIKSDLDGRLKRWLTTQSNTTTRDNNWGNNQLPQSYSHPTSSSKSLIGDSVTFYANGAKSERGLTVKANMVFFVGVYYVADITSDDSDSDAV